MEWWVWLLLGGCLVLLLMWFSRVTVHLYYSRVKDNDRFFLGLHVVYGVFRYRLEVPVLKFKGLLSGLSLKSEQIDDKQGELMGESDHKITSEKVIRYFEKARIALKATLGMKDWVKESLSKVHCTDLKWDTRVGVGDAAETAITTGVIWSLKSSLLTFVFQFVKLDCKPQVMVVPQYNQTHFTTEISCITKIRLGHAITAALLLIVRIMKVKGGLKAWQSILSRA